MSTQDEMELGKQKVKEAAERAEQAKKQAEAAEKKANRAAKGEDNGVDPAPLYMEQRDGEKVMTPVPLVDPTDPNVRAQTPEEKKADELIEAAKERDVAQEQIAEKRRQVAAEAAKKAKERGAVVPGEKAPKAGDVVEDDKGNAPPDGGGLKPDPVKTPDTGKQSAARESEPAPTKKLSAQEADDELDKLLNG